MKVFSAQQIKEWDSISIQEENIVSMDLMERAASLVWDEIRQDEHLLINFFCGYGNNGGDGLVIARLFKERTSRPVRVFLFGKKERASDDFLINYHRCLDLGVRINVVEELQQMPLIQPEESIVDALLGSGTNKPAEGIFAAAIDLMNTSGATIYSVDLPSGIMPDQLHQPQMHIIRATHTYTFQSYKKAFLGEKASRFTGNIKLMDIGLSENYYGSQNSNLRVINEEVLRGRLEPRAQNSSKRDFGHALVIGGSEGMIGALLLAGKACVRSGAGLTNLYVPNEFKNTVYSALPEAMLLDSSAAHHCLPLADISKFTAIGCGPGIGKHPETRTFLKELLTTSPVPLVLDADALNIIAEEKWIELIPKGSVITPHQKEFERLFGTFENEDVQMDKQLQESERLQIYILRKGRVSVLSTPRGNCYANITGNAALAKGGSGDVLTGMITGLFARVKNMGSAALLAMYLHGKAADLFVEEKSEECMLASDIIELLPIAFKKLSP